MNGENRPLIGVPTVLVVDDSPTARVWIKGVLEYGGYRVMTAPNGAEGLEAFLRQAPDLVVLDVFMPGIDGFGVCRQLRGLPGGAAVPVLFLTAEEDEALQDRALAAGGDDLVFKPAISRELLIRVKSLLRIRGLSRQVEQERDRILGLKEQRERLFRFLVHDLKGGLQALDSGAELLRLRGGGPREMEEHGLRVQDVTRRMVRMVQDFLDVERHAEGSLAVQSLPVALSLILGSCHAQAGALFSQRNQVCDLDVPAEVVAWADPELVHRVVTNLLDNGSKYSPEGAALKLQARRAGDRVVVQVRDQGPGVPDEFKERIFEPFFRLERDHRPARASSGLGLAFCRVAAEAMGGGIHVEDAPGGGSAFCLELRAFSAEAD